MPLKLNGKILDLNAPTPTLAALKEKLDKLPADEVFTADVISKKLGISHSYIRDNGPSELLASNTVKLSGIRYWGSPKAIAALRARVAR